MQSISSYINPNTRGLTSNYKNTAMAAAHECIRGMEEVTEKILTIFWKTGSGGMNWNRAIFLKRIIRFW